MPVKAAPRALEDPQAGEVGAGAAAPVGREVDGGAGAGGDVPPVVVPKPPVDADSHMQVHEDGQAGGQLQPVLPVDPREAHRQYLAGQLPDSSAFYPPSASGASADVCRLRGTMNGQLLDRLEVAPPDPDTGSEEGDNDVNGNRRVRLFCGIYTMEKNHETQVKVSGCLISTCYYTTRCLSAHVYPSETPICLHLSVYLNTPMYIRTLTYTYLYRPPF